MLIKKILNYLRRPKVAERRDMSPGAVKRLTVTEMDFYDMIVIDDGELVPCSKGNPERQLPRLGWQFVGNYRNSDGRVVQKWRKEYK
jgi:hypothetical protein